MVTSWRTAHFQLPARRPWMDSPILLSFSVLLEALLLAVVGGFLGAGLAYVAFDASGPPP